MKNKARVHRLPTEGKTGVIWMNRKTSSLYPDVLNVVKDKLYFGQHLYVTTDEAPNVGDSVLVDIYPHGNPEWKLAKVVSVYESVVEVDLGWSTTQTKPIVVCKKIIATTDPKLHTNEIVEEDMHMYKKSLPKIPQSFIEEYCEAGGIDEVLVEYHPKGCSYGNIILDDLNGDGSYYGDNNKYEVEISRSRKEVESYGAKFHDSLLKLDNNCIIIHPVEEKMYSRDEILHKLTIKSLREKFHSQSGMFINKQTSYEIIKWIEENL